MTTRYLHQPHRRNTVSCWQPPPPPPHYNYIPDHQFRGASRHQPPPPSPLPLINYKSFPTQLCNNLRPQQPPPPPPPLADLRVYSPSSPYYSAVSPNYVGSFYYPDQVEESLVYSPTSVSPVYAPASPVVLPPSSAEDVPPGSPPGSPVYSMSDSPMHEFTSPMYSPEWQSYNIL